MITTHVCIRQQRQNVAKKGKKPDSESFTGNPRIPVPKMAATVTKKQLKYKKNALQQDKSSERSAMMSRDKLGSQISWIDYAIRQDAQRALQSDR